MINTSVWMSCPGHDAVHYFCHLVMNVKAYLTLAPFTVVSAYSNKSFIVLQDLTSFKLYHQVVISQHLDLTLLYADWTCREIKSLNHSHL